MGAAAEPALARAKAATASRSAPGAGVPIDQDEFAALMAPLGPFERPPRLAVAVSGGADSMALALLARDWAVARRGMILALTVDHGLRAESAAEAARVGGWLARRGIAHEALRWTDAKPRAGIQRKARAARYALLFDRCREHGIVHLLVGHHRDDQAETVGLRLDHGSGPDGLAAMAPVVPASAARLLRPLLGLPRTRLEASLTARGQHWIDDPSNENPAYARVRLRRRLAAHGGESDRFAALSVAMAGARAERERAAAETLARAVTLTSEGYAVLDAVPIVAAGAEMAMRVLDRTIRAVGGGAYPIAADPLGRLWRALGAAPGRGRSLGGCLIAPRRAGWLVVREPAAVEPPVAAAAGQRLRWDGRFDLSLGGRGEGRVGPLGRDGWAAIRTAVGPVGVPHSAVITLPALFDAEGLAAVPHLGWRRASAITVESADFAPNCPLMGLFRGR